MKYIQFSEPHRDALLDGRHIKKNQQTRLWHNAKVTGAYMVNRNGDTLLEVLDSQKGDAFRCVNLGTFTGTITFVDGTHCDYDHGVKVGSTRTTETVNDY